VTTTQGTRDAVAALEAAIDQTETLLGDELLRDCLDHHTGELTPVVVVTDNGSAYHSAGFARFIASRPELLHVRTRHRLPQPMRFDCRLSLSTWVLDDTRRLRGWLPQTMPQSWGLAPLSAPSKATGSGGIA
jgi:transposase InsO family protein